MKKKILFFASLLAFVTQSANAQLLWKISGNGSEKVSYLFGTHHIASTKICDSIAGFNEAFNSCQQLYGELLMDDMVGMAKDMMAYAMMPKDTTWKMLYTEQEYKVIDDFMLQQMGCNIEVLKTVKPVVVTTQLTVKMSAEIFGDYKADQQLDMTLQKRAKEQAMEVKGFESLEFQSALLFGAPLEEQASDLMNMVKDFEKTKQGSIEMCELYKKQDLDAMLEFMDKPEFGMTKASKERMLDNRNRNWVEQLKDVLPQHSTFIVVGAGHLPGEQGMINLLRKQGYQVTPVK